MLSVEVAQASYLVGDGSSAKAVAVNGVVPQIGSPLVSKPRKSVTDTWFTPVPLSVATKSAVMSYALPIQHPGFGIVSEQFVTKPISFGTTVGPRLSTRTVLPKSKAPPSSRLNR